MPARTNEFQELVSLIERTLAPKGARITDSTEIEVFGLTTTREVDILIEGPYGPYTIKVAVEAKDEGRRIDIGTFDALTQKYRGECRVLVDKFVIVSRQGFTKGVVEKAAMLDVELLTLDEAKDKDWSKIGPGNFNFRKPPHICGIFFLPPIQVSNPQDLWIHARLICPHGHDHGTPMARANCLVFHNLFPSNPDMVKDFLKQVEHSSGGEGVLKGSWPHKGFKVRYHSQEYEISSMAIHVHAVSQTGNAKHTVFHRHSSRGDSRLLHHIKGTAGNTELSLLIPDGPVPPPQIGLRLRRAGNPTNAEGNKKGKKGGRRPR